MGVDSSSSAPVRYEMMGYDTLLGSHCDKFYLDYSKLQIKTLNASVFDNTSFGEISILKSLILSIKKHFCVCGGGVVVGDVGVKDKGCRCTINSD